MHRFKDIELVKEDVNKKHLCKSLMVITLHTSQQLSYCAVTQ